VRLARFDARGPHQSPQKRSLVRVSLLQSLAGAEFAHMRHCEIFEASRFSSFSTQSAQSRRSAEFARR
jgi:hypothetical protein